MKIKILVLGSRGAGLYCFPCESLVEEFNKIAFAQFVSCEELMSQMTKEEYQEYHINKKPIKLSHLKIGFIPDLVFADQGDLHFENDLHIPVIYWHLFLHRPLIMKNPSVVLFINDQYQKYYETMINPYELSKVKVKGVLFPAVNKNIYKPEKKEYIGISGIGDRFSVERIKSDTEVAKKAHMILFLKEREEFKQTNLRFFESPISDEEYRKILPKCEAIWLYVAETQYITRKLLEAMACKTLCIIKLEDEEHEAFLKKMGYINGKHYIGVDKISEVEQAFIETTNKEEIVENAYKITMMNHTYSSRAQTIIDIYNIYFGNLFKPKIKLPEILDLGCGTDKTKDAYGIDIVNLDGVDLIHDLNIIPYPFESNSFRKIIMNDILEHLDDPPKVIEECYRLLKEGGELRIKVVYFAHKYAWGDPTHIHAFSEVYFEFFCKKTRRRDYYYDFAFEDIKINFIHDKDEIQGMEVILVK